MLKLSVVMITKNEEEILPLSLASVKGWADEIVVVDSGSSDGTVAIAKEAGARVFFREFDNFAAQYNWAMEQAAGPWILILDADEAVDEKLREGIQSLLAGDPQYEIYDIKRDSMFLGKDMLSWKIENDTIARLFRKGCFRYEGYVHSVIDIGGRSKGTLPGRLIHYPIRSIPHYMIKRRHYASLWAEDTFKKGKKQPGIAKAVLSAGWRFTYDFFIRGQILDGRYGFLMSVLAMQYTFEKYIFLWDLQRREREKKAKGGDAGVARK